MAIKADITVEPLPRHFSSMRMRKSGLYSPPGNLDTLERFPTDNIQDLPYCMEIPYSMPEENRIIRTTYEKIRKLSNFASWLCVLDCTLLPIITVALPLFGFLKLENNQLECFDRIGHTMALFFVLPVGSLSAVMNYPSHGQNWIGSLAAVGLLLVAMANSDSLPVIGHTAFFHLLHNGAVHRIINICGCVLLLLSNYLSHQYSGKKCCLLHQSESRTSRKRTVGIHSV